MYCPLKIMFLNIKSEKLIAKMLLNSFLADIIAQLS